MILSTVRFIKEQKKYEYPNFHFDDSITDGPTDQQMDGPTNQPMNEPAFIYKDARMHIITSNPRIE